jgi:hypothetical protein
MKTEIKVFKLKGHETILVFPDLYLCFKLTIVPDSGRATLIGWYMETVSLPINLADMPNDFDKSIIAGKIWYNGDIQDFSYKPNYFGGTEYLRNLTEAISAMYNYLNTECAAWFFLDDKI